MSDSKVSGGDSVSTTESNGLETKIHDGIPTIQLDTAAFVEASPFDDGGDETEDFLTSDHAVAMNITAAVPRLDDLIVKTLAENYDIYPAFDRIPPEYLDNVVALLDPSQISFVVAAKHIQAEKFWKRLCYERWPIITTSAHGQSYKRLYIERHLQGLFESYYPSEDGDNYERLITEVREGAPYVMKIVIKQLLSHLDVSQLMSEFTQLKTLSLTYGARKLGMDYDKSLFGMQHNDAMILSKYLSKPKLQLCNLILSENLLTDESMQILAKGLSNNFTITNLDLSHNTIGNIGAKRLCTLLEKNRVLSVLNLSGNAITGQGAQALGAAIAQSNSLLEFSIRLNPLGDEGGAAIIEGAEFNQSLMKLDVGACNLQTRSTKALVSLCMRNNILKSLDISANEIQEDGITGLLHAFNKYNTSLTWLDFRRTPMYKSEGAEEINKIMKVRFAEMKQKNREMYQDGWDDVM